MQPELQPNGCRLRPNSVGLFSEYAGLVTWPPTAATRGIRGDPMGDEQPDVFPARLAALRAAAGLTGPELAARAGLSRQAVRQYENGNRRPTFDAVLKLAAALGTDCRAFAPITSSGITPDQSADPQHDADASVDDSTDSK